MIAEWNTYPVETTDSHRVVVADQETLYWGECDGDETDEQVKEDFLADYNGDLTRFNILARLSPGETYSENDQAES